MKILLSLLMTLALVPSHATCPTEEIYPDAHYPELTVVTNLGDIVIELDRGRAPLTVNRFLHYVKSKTYDDNLIHRVEPDYVIQMGAFKTDNSDVKGCGNIFNESGNGLKNDRGTLAMARYDDAHSASTSFFINLKDNHNLDPNKKSWGYAVFGYVVSGMEVIDLIIQGKTAFNAQLNAPNVPVKPIIIKSVRLNQ